MTVKNEQTTRGRILAVDDCAQMRLLVQTYLEPVGYSVEAVDSGLAALEAAHLEEFDAVVLDVEMPGLDGLAVGRALREHPNTSAFMIAMHTSLDETTVRAGFDQYDVFLPKPCTPQELRDCVDRLVQHRQHDRGLVAQACVSVSLPPDR